MIETKRLTSKADLNSDVRIPVLSKLEEDGWTPAILESERAFTRLAGVAGKLDVDMLRLSEDPRYTRSLNLIHFGEVFFKEDDVYYVIAYDERMRRRYRASPEEGDLEIGVISSSPDGLADRLSSFAQSIETAVKSSIDGRKARHMKFDWKHSQPGIRVLSKVLGEESTAEFVRASLAVEDVQACGVLMSQTARELLIELNQAGFAREQDLSKKWGRKQEEFEQAVESLKVHSLIETEYLLECKRHTTPLTRFKDKNQLDIDGVSELICPSCGLTFKEERLSEGYTVSDLGRKMSRQSQWMTIWVTQLLVELGVPIESILWNLSENGEEVDILMEFLGQLWIFELKDREFGAGDAHPLNYRQVRFRATKAVVVTTDKVSPDAKRVFRELQREAAPHRRYVEPTYIEGLAQAKDVLNRELSRLSLGYASNLLEVIGRNSGLNLKTVLAARFGEPIESVPDEDEMIF